MRYIIAEKDIAARRICEILSNGDYERERIGSINVYRFKSAVVLGLRGHITKIDYPKKYKNWRSIKPRELIRVEPEFEVENEYRKILSIFEGADTIIATDYDREGELIGLEFLEAAHKKTAKRAKFSSMSREEIVSAFSNLVEMDIGLAMAARARQYIDLAWGATLTRSISMLARLYGEDFLSIGRVQTPTLAILAKREMEIKRFKSKKYWEIVAKYKKLIFKYGKKFWKKDEAEEIYGKLKRRKRRCGRG